MAPSRGFQLPFKPHTWRILSFPRRERQLSTFQSLVSSPTSNLQIYISRSLSPHLNLSIEHYLLQHTPPHSTILFLYTNAPSIIIGRNQNPYTEVNLRLLNPTNSPDPNIPPSLAQNPPELVRRRSGGGTVFHDTGNINYSVITPPSTFHRDKHALMVARALHALGRPNAHVNERHDIVLLPDSDASETPRKVSGSAYKLTRLRALHHGTCLLSSPHLHVLHQYLRPQGRAFIKARGVESVSSPVANVEVRNDEFERAVVSEFAGMYGVDRDSARHLFGMEGPRERDGWVGGIVGEPEAEVEEIAKGVGELKSLDWVYGQTPQFTLSSHATPEDPRPRPPLPASFPSSVSAHLSLALNQS